MYKIRKLDEQACLLYTSDAADEQRGVDQGEDGRVQKKNKQEESICEVVE